MTKIVISFEIDTREELEFFTNCVSDQLRTARQDTVDYADKADNLGRWRYERAIAQERSLERLYESCVGSLRKGLSDAK